MMFSLMLAVDAGRREVGWLVCPSVWRGGVVVLTRGKFRSMVKTSWAEEAVYRKLMHVIKAESRPLWAVRGIVRRSRVISR